MYLDRGLQAAVGIVLAFSILWTVAILIPDNRSSTRPMGSTMNGDASGVIIHSGYPRIVKSTKQKVRGASTTQSAQTSRQTRVLKYSQGQAQTQPIATEPQPTYSTESGKQQTHQTKRLFPAHVWYLTALFLFKTRNYVKKRSRREFDYADESFFVKSGLETSLEYGHSSEYEDPDEFLSVNSSVNYGSSSRWTPDLNNKFDLEDLGLEYEIPDHLS